MKLLIIEADRVIPDIITRVAKNHFGDYEQQIITGVYNASKEKIVASIKWCDVLLFQSTFTQTGEVQHLIEIALRVNKPMEVFINTSYAEQTMNRFLTDEQLFAVDKLGIKMYEVSHSYYQKDIRDIPLLFTERLIKVRAEMEEKRIIEETRLNYVQSGIERPTGRKIKILNITAFGEQWNTLIPGSIVDEIDMSHVETEYGRNRGVWVMGKSEGVKLLNEDGRNEYEIVSQISVDQVAMEILSGVYKSDTDAKTAFAVIGILTNINKSMSSEDASTEICDILNIERRGNRAIIRKTISQHNYLFEAVA